MATFYNPKIVTNGLRIGLDVANSKCYPGSGSTIFSLNNRENATVSSITTAEDPLSKTIFDFNASTDITINLSPNVNHEEWSFMIWLKSTGTTSSNYRSVLWLEQAGGGAVYFYNLDTREVANSYLLGYQRDFYINSWLTRNFNTAAEWAEQTWWCIGVSHNNKVFKNYKQGNLFSTQTQTRAVDDYTDLTRIVLNRNDGNTVYLGPFYFYDRVLSDNEFKQNFNATRGRFGL